MGKKKNWRNVITNFFSTIFNNAAAYNLYYDRLKEVTVTLYNWLNLPDEIDQRFLELMLYERGKVLFFYDEGLQQYVVMNTNLPGKWDIYNNPIRRDAYANNGYNVTKNKDNSVIIYNNILRTSSESETIYFADKLGFYDRIVDININAQKTPILLKCPENKRLTLKNMWMKYDGNEPMIATDEMIGLDGSGIEVLKTDAPFVADQIYEMKIKYWNEFLTFKGISNVNIASRERMTNDEVYRQLGGSLACRGSGMRMRKEAAKQINKMFGLEIDVVFNEEYQIQVLDAANEIIDPSDQEGGSNE